MAQRRRRLSGHTGMVLSAAFSPDGKLAVTAASDKSARIWDADTGVLITPLAGHARAVTQISFSPDGGRILTASQDKTARIWDAKTGALLVTLAGHSRAVASAQFSADGKRVVTASHDKTARVWDAQTGALLATLPTDASEAQTIAISRDGTHVVVACYDGAARIWDITAFSRTEPVVRASGATASGSLAAHFQRQQRQADALQEQRGADDGAKRPAGRRGQVEQDQQPGDDRDHRREDQPAAARPSRARRR